jgi:hypothetical protein
LTGVIERILALGIKGYPFVISDLLRVDSSEGMFVSYSQGMILYRIAGKNADNCSHLIYNSLDGIFIPSEESTLNKSDITKGYPFIPRANILSRHLIQGKNWITYDVSEYKIPYFLRVKVLTTDHPT